MPIVKMPVTVRRVSATKSRYIPKYFPEFKLIEGAHYFWVETSDSRKARTYRKWVESLKWFVEVSITDAEARDLMMKYPDVIYPSYICEFCRIFQTQSHVTLVEHENTCTERPVSEAIVENIMVSESE